MLEYMTVKRMLQFSSRAARWMGIWHLRRSTPLDEVVQGGTGVEYMVEEPQEQMPSFGDHVAGRSLKEAAASRSRSVGLRPVRRRSEPMEPYTEAQRVVV